MVDENEQKTDGLSEKNKLHITGLDLLNATNVKYRSSSGSAKLSLEGPKAEFTLFDDPGMDQPKDSE